MIFHNATALLNQVSLEGLADLGITLLPDGTVLGLPEFPFEVGDENCDTYEDEDPTWKDAVPRIREPLNPIPMLMENINRAKHE